MNCTYPNDLLHDLNMFNLTSSRYDASMYHSNNYVLKKDQLEPMKQLIVNGDELVRKLVQFQKQYVNDTNCFSRVQWNIEDTLNRLDNLRESCNMISEHDQMSERKHVPIITQTRFKPLKQSLKLSFGRRVRRRRKSRSSRRKRRRMSRKSRTIKRKRRRSL